MNHKDSKGYVHTYKDSDDPLASWGVLRRDIKGLSLARLNRLLARELANKNRAIIVRTLRGRINRLKASKEGRYRLTKAEYAAQKE